METQLFRSDFNLVELSLEEMIQVGGGSFFGDLWAGFKDGFLTALFIIVIMVA
jgi:hypothetical protein